MLRLALRVSALLAVVCVLPPSLSIARELTFEDRVRAQEAIERVYYSHQIGATNPFEEAVPRDVLERKVRTYLKQSVALEKFWHTPVTAQMLQRELERMARGTRMPERLQELYAALDNDPFLIAECLARATLVNRLSRNFFAFDPVIHSDTRRRAEMLHRQLVEGELDPFDEHPDRTVAEWVRMADVDGSSSAGEEPPSRSHGELGDHQFRLESEEYGKRRGRFPEAVGEIGPLVEGREAFVVRVLLDETAGEARVAGFVVKKADWTDWWASVEERVDERAIRTVATGHDPLPFIGSVTGSLEGTRLDNLPGPFGGAGEGTSSCPEDDTWDNGVLDLPDPRYQHTAVWTGSLMIVWGGFDGDSDLDTGGRYDPATDSWTSTSTTGAPSVRSAHTAVWTGSLMVVWGGFPPSTANTGGRYDPSTDSWTSTSTTDAPSGRTRHAAVWTGSLMVVWGGYDPSFSNTGGRYDPAMDSWTPTSTTGAPSGRLDHTAVWTGNVMVVWGGFDPSYTNTGGRYDPATDNWTPTSTTGAPSARNRHTAVWTSSLMVVWGGWDGSYLKTGGRYDPSTDSWTPTSTTGAPSGRLGHAAVWTGSLMVVWGGWDGSYLKTGGRYNPTANRWTLASTAGAPSARAIHTAVWTGSLMVVWGGGDGSYLNTGGRYDPATDSWTPTSPAGAPSVRSDHTAVWTGSLMVVWGGSDGSRLNTGGRYDPATDSWTPTSTTGAPSSRYDHTAVWTGSVMVVWGGFDGSSLITGGRYDPATDSWTPTSTVGTPSDRSIHTAVWTGTLMVVWGGDSGGGSYLNSGGRYDPATDSWAQTSTEGAPSARRNHTAAWMDGLMVVWGGWDGSYLNTGGRYDPATDTWTPTSTTGAPSARSYHTAVWSGSLMVVWGGGGGSRQKTGGRYDPSTDSWTPTSTTGAPSARSYHTAVWTGSVMVVWGGSDYSWVNTGGRYDPSTDSWSPTSTEAAPSGRWSHTAVWTGNLMIIWGGGTPDGPHLNSGGRYALGNSDDDDGDGFSECDGDCNDGNDVIYPGAPEICDDVDNQCPGDAGHAQVDEACDDDGDGSCDGEMIVVGTPSVCPSGGGDCNDHDSNTYPGASETNDGSNNQCPGDDGYGVVDEISGESGFHNPAERTEFSWPDQAGATSYEVARSSAPDFSANCIQVTRTDAYWIDLATPDEGAGFFYLVRPLTPFVGSWGEDSTGVERTHICPLNPNVVLNGDMESWTSSTNLSVWQETRTAGTIDQETDPGYVYEGDSAARLTRTSSGVFNIMQTSIPLEPGEDYRLKVAAMFKETRAGALQVRILNATRGEDLRTDGTWSTGWHYFDFDLTPSYQRHQIDFTVDAGYDATDDFRLIIRHNNVTPTPIGSELWIDDVEIRAQ